MARFSPIQRMRTVGVVAGFRHPRSEDQHCSRDVDTNQGLIRGRIAAIRSRDPAIQWSTSFR